MARISHWYSPIDESDEEKEKSCIQQTTLANDLGGSAHQWECLSGSETTLEGLAYFDDGRSHHVVYSNWFRFEKNL